MKDNVNHPTHYCKGNIECIDAINTALDGLSGVEGYYIGNIIKYLWRWKDKNGVEDIKKAQWYLNRLIQNLDADNTNECPQCKSFVGCESASRGKVCDLFELDKK